MCGSNSEFKMDGQTGSKAKSTTKRDMFQKVTRQLMLHFTCYIEIVSAAAKSNSDNAFLRQLMSNTT